MALIPIGKRLPLAIKPVDAKGNPAQVDGTPAWLSSDPLIAAVTPAADGLSAVVRPGANVGTAQVSVSADADLGAGVITLTGMIEIETVSGQAVSIGIIAGALEDDV